MTIAMPGLPAATIDRQPLTGGAHVSGDIAPRFALPANQLRLLGNVVDVEELHAGLAGRLACRRGVATGGRVDCIEAVGSQLVRYRSERGSVVISTEYGPAYSNMWQILSQPGGDAAPAIHDRVAYTKIDSHGRRQPVVAWEERPGVRVVVSAADDLDPTTVDVIADAVVAGAQNPAAVPIVIGDATAESSSSIGAKYFAATIAIAQGTECMAGIGIPWNSPPSCVDLSPVANGALVTIATPSPVGTIVAAAAPSRTVRLRFIQGDEALAETQTRSAMGTAVQTSFMTLGALQPDHIEAVDAAGNVIARAPLHSAAPLGYLPK